MKCIVADFSKTLTSHLCPTSWSVCAKDGCLGEEYVLQRNALFKEYHPYEVAGDVDMASEWFYKHLLLFRDFGITQNMVDRLVSTPEYFSPRDGLSAFWHDAQAGGYELHIVSSGFEEFIEGFLHLQGAKRYTLTANRMGVGRNVSSFEETITPINKQRFAVDVSEYDEVILLGDDTGDLCMISGESRVRKVAFNTQEDAPGFDVYLGRDGSLRDVFKGD